MIIGTYLPAAEIATLGIIAAAVLVYRWAICLPPSEKKTEMEEGTDSTSSFLHRFGTERDSRKTLFPYLSSFSMRDRTTGVGGHKNKEK